MVRWLAVVRRRCLLRSGPVIVLPGREALTNVLTVDQDSHQVVVLARDELDPELDRVWLTMRKPSKGSLDELAVDPGAIAGR